MMNIVTTYLYGSHDSDIYMKHPEGFMYARHINLDLEKATP